MNQCIYCGISENITREHVIPRGLFPKGYNIVHPVIVSACRTCNQRVSADEEFFRNFITTIGSDYSENADNIFNQAVKRSIQRFPNIGRRMTSLMKEVEVYSPHGIYLGIKTKIQIPDVDWDRYHSVLTKIVRGLFNHETNLKIPDGYRIKHFWGDTNQMSKIKDEHLKILNRLPKWNKDNHPIFTYGFGLVENGFQSAWATIFYDSIFFLSFVVVEEYAIELDNKKK